MKIDHNNLTLLDDLIAQIHDYWFDIDMIKYEKEKGIFKLFLGRSTEGPFDNCITITAVKDWYLNDTEQVGFYDINKFTIDPKSWCINIICNIPLDMVVKVDTSFTVALTADGHEG